MTTAGKIIAGLFILLFLPAYAQDNDFKAGFKVIQLYDSARRYKPNSSASDKLHYRPIDVDLWYPAHVISTDTTVRLYDLIRLLESRSKFYDDTKDYTGLTEEFLQYIYTHFDCTDCNKIKEVKTESYVNAAPIGDTFPLIIYFAGLNGMSYENYLLFESLAKKGFVVASISSIGRYPGNMTLEIEDVMEQIHDAMFIIHHFSKSKFLSEKIGLVGYSWGGLAATLLSMMEPLRFEAIVSLNGSEQFQYGDADDEKLNRIRTSEIFKPETVRGSYLYLDSDIKDAGILPDSVYNITNFITSDKNYLKINNSTHENFSSLSVHASAEDKLKYELIQKLTVNYLSDKLKGENIFYKSIPEKGVELQFSALPKNKFNQTQKFIQGIILDGKTNLPLPYVNVGLPHKDIGTTTDANGKFILKFFELNAHDSLRISMVGYATKEYDLNNLISASAKPLTVRLQEKTSELKEIVILDKKLKTKTFGNKTVSKFFGGKFASDDYGSEMAIKINIRKGPIYLDKFQVNISYNMEDSATLRLNIYNAKNGLPYQNILSQNIILKLGNQTGKIEVDLSKYNIVIKEDFFIALEWIEGSNNSGIVFSAGFVNKGTYYRKASQGRWKKYPMGVGFNVTAKY